MINMIILLLLEDNKLITLIILLYWLCFIFLFSVRSSFLFHLLISSIILFFFFQAEDVIRDLIVTGVQTCALPISGRVDHNARAQRRDAPGEQVADADS